MKERRNYYRILRVQPDAPPEIIQASYRALMKDLQRHPDLGGSTEEAFVLNEAYETLHDPEKRAAYDNRMFQNSIDGGGWFVRKDISPALCPVCKGKLSGKLRPGDICRNCRTPLQSELEIEDIGDERRAISRIKSSAPVNYYPAWPGEPQQGRMLDFSPKGMRFLCSEKLPLQVVLKISCSQLEAAGVVTNLSEELSGEQKYYAVGILFLAVSFTDARGTFLSTSA